MIVYHLTNSVMTVSVSVNDKDIIETCPPLLRSFVGNELGVLVRWMGSRGKCKVDKIKEVGSNV